MLGRSPQRVVVGVRGLHHDPRRASGPAGPAGDLGDQGEGVLGRPVVGEMEWKIRIHDRDACHRRQVKAAGDELRAHQDVRAALAKRLPDLEVRIGPTRSIAVQAQHPRSRPQLFDHPLQALRAHAQGADLAAPAVVASGGHRA